MILRSWVMRRVLSKTEVISDCVVESDMVGWTGRRTNRMFYDFIASFLSLVKYIFCLVGPCLLTS